MMHVLIADDEIKVCQLIYKLIGWEALGLTMSGMVHSGIDAYEFIRTHQPEIVITDIRMPGCDGLELIRRARTEGWTTRFIIISGYKHFEYAHHAIRYGVEDYLLKPIKKDELNQTLKKIKADHDARCSQHQKESVVSQQLEMNRNQLRKQYIKDVMAQSDQDNERDIDQLNRIYQLKFERGVFQAISVKLDILSDDPCVESDHGKALEKIREILQDHLSPVCAEILITIKGTCVMAIVNYPSLMQGSIHGRCQVLLEDIKAYLALYENYLCTIGIGEKAAVIQDMHLSLASAQSALRQRICSGTDRIIDGGKVAGTMQEEKNSLAPETLLQIRNSLDAYDRFAFKRHIWELFDLSRCNGEQEGASLFAWAEQIFELFIKKVESDGGKTESSLFRAQFEAAMEHAYDVGKIREALTRQVDAYMEACMESRKNQEFKPIRVAKAYIEAHYPMTISLEDIAGEVHLNPVYFSVLFKKEVGMNFTDYLMNLRIEKSKAFLRETDQCLSTVAERVGYKDAKYFSKLFGKKVGIKPGEYRKLYR